ncbi:class II aldolase/adducin family protein [Rubrobacter marinus]|nr:class II aldolase/adducin family protein [Rubrobacter marinus]
MNHAEHQDLREMAAVARRLVSSGLVTGTPGDAGARTPEGDVPITPTGLPREVVGPESIVLADLDGELPEPPVHNGIQDAASRGGRGPHPLALRGRPRASGMARPAGPLRAHDPRPRRREGGVAGAPRDRRGQKIPCREKREIN